MTVNLGHFFTASSFHYEHPEKEDFSPLKIMLGRRKFPFETGPFSQGTIQFLHFREGKHPASTWHIGSTCRSDGFQVQELDEARNNYLDAIDLLMDLEDFWWKFSEHFRSETSSWRRKNAEKMRLPTWKHACHIMSPPLLGGGFHFDHPPFT